jgi:hypothetical protein
MSYLTFVAGPRHWRLHLGIGSDGQMLAERQDVPELFDFSAGRSPILWTCAREPASGRTAIYRVNLPELSLEPVSWGGVRIGALATAPDNQKIVVLVLPANTRGKPEILVGDGHFWSVVPTRVNPDISSKLTWLEGKRIVYEADDRRLIYFDMESGFYSTGPCGSCPVASWSAREWFAISAGRVVRFPFDDPFGQQPARIEGLDLDKAVTLRASSDGQAFTWTVAQSLHRSKGFVQQKGDPRRRFRDLDNGSRVGAVLGPYALPT